MVEPIWKTVWVSTGSPPFSRYAEALGVDQLVARDDADGEAGIVEGLHAALDVGLELGNERLDLGVHRLLRGARTAQAHSKHRHNRDCDARNE